MTSTVRSVRVVMEADVAGYIANIRLAGHETDAAFSHTGSQLGTVNRGLKDVDTSSKQAASSLKQVETSSNRTGKEVDKLSGRLGILRDVGLTLGPALIPLAEGILPAITGGIAGLGAGASAIGVAVLALHGLGAGIKALDAYKLDPTIQNLDKLRAAEQKLGPAGTQFLQYVDQLEPKLRGLQQVARAGWFPGLETGINDLLQRLPLVRGIVKSVSEELGVLSADAGHSLSSSEWRPFFQYIRTEAAPTLDAFARSAGNVVLGLANMLVAFGPASSDFASGLQADTQRFANWSKSLDQNQGFQNFLSEVRQEGPQVLHLLGALGGAVGGIVKAAAPWGNLLLPILTDVLKVFTAIASSRVGPALYTTAAAMLLYSKATGLAASANKRFEASSATMGGTLGRTAVGLGLVAAGSTDAAHRIGLANTAMDTGVGLIVGGPWGAAVGFAVGLYQDLSSASDRAASSAHDLQTVMADSPTAFGAQAAGIETVVKKAVALRAQFDSGNRSNETSLSYWDDLGRQILHGVGVPIQTVTDQMDAAATKAQADAQRMMVAVATIARGTGDTSVPTPQDLSQGRAGFIDTVTGPKVDTSSLDALEAAAKRLQPTLDALGISWKDLAKESPAQLQATVAAIQAYNTQADSTRGKNQAVASSFQALDSTLSSTASSASAVSDALNSLLSPKLDLSAATDAWTAGLHALKDNLDKTNKSLTGNSDAAIKNRGAIRDQVTALTAQLSAQAAAGAGAGKLTKTLQDNRQALINAGAAAGISRSDMVKYLDTLGLTPKLVKTVIEANTSQAQSNVNALLNGIANLHDRTVTITMHTVHTDSSGVSYQHGGTPPPHADGGLITGPGGPRDDRILARLSNREYVMPAASVDHYGVGVMNAIRARRFADGGPVDTHPRTNPGDRPAGSDQNKAHQYDQVLLPFVQGIEHASTTLKALNIELKSVQAAYTKEKQKLTDLTSARDTLSSSVSGSLIHDPFGNGLAGFDAQVAADTGDITAMAQALSTLVQHGLDPKSALYQALAASDDVNTAQQLAALSSTDLSTRAQSFQQRQDLAGSLGQTVGNQVYAQAIAKQTDVDRKLAAEIHQLNQAIKDMPKHVQKGAHDGAKSGSHAGSEAGAAAGTKRGMDERNRTVGNRVRTNG